MFVMMTKGDIRLLILYVLFCSVSLFRAYVSNNSYITVDSKHYFRAAKNFKEGKGFVTPDSIPFAHADKDVQLTKWPIGYSFCIASFAYLTGGDIVLASKLVNFFFLGLSLLLLRKLFGSETWIIALAFLSFTSFQIYTYSWSEGPFLFTTCWLAYIIIRWEKIKLNWLALACCLTISFLFRYAAVIYFVQVALMIPPLILSRRKNAWTSYVIGLGIASLLISTYLYYNHSISGHITGMDRLESFNESTGDFFMMLLLGVGNELLFFGYVSFKLNPYIDWLIISLHIIFYFTLIRERRHSVKLNKFNPIDRAGLVFFSLGLFYFIGICLIRYFSTFDALDSRLLAPASIPIFIGIMIWLTNPIRRAYFQRIKFFLILLVIMSIILALPKSYLLGLFQ